jgi:imidazole glycerol phosphate synthase glutamine amidotransferase subunit
MEVVVVPTGAANLASLAAALRRLGATMRLATTAADILGAERLILPGVGAFGAAMAQLDARGFTAALRTRWQDPRPALGVCLGMQLLFERSEESPGVAGLGIVKGEVTRMGPSAGRVPFFGWSQVNGPVEGCAYFAHSFRWDAVDDIGSWNVSRARHDASPNGFAGAISRGAHLACQFHPELSGDWGSSLLRAWLRAEPLPREVEVSAGRTNRIIPCLDVRDGRVVKGIKFQSLRDAGDPVAQAQLYESQGADELVMLDVSATPEGRATSLRTVSDIRSVLSVPLTVGGGVRSVENAGALLDAGADKVGVNTAAVADPSLITRLADRFGAQCVVLAIDAARHEAGWQVRVRSGGVATQLDAVEWAREGVRCGAGEILLTSVDRDGTGAGYDLELLRAVSAAVPVPVIASGGGATSEHMRQAVEAGADALLAASIFHDGVFTVGDIKQQLAGLGVGVRAARKGSSC